MASRNVSENTSGGVGYPRVGQWYSRADKGEMFQVTGRDYRAGTVEIQSFDGDVDEIDVEAWATPTRRPNPSITLASISTPAVRMSLWMRCSIDSPALCEWRYPRCSMARGPRMS